MKRLLVEDESGIAAAMARILEREGYVVDIAEDLVTAEEAILSTFYDIVLLDRCLPDGHGDDLVAFARCRGLNLRFLMVTALADLDDRVEGLDSGADDYIVKPFEPQELLARMRAALRRPLPEKLRLVRIGNLEFDHNSRSVEVAGKPLILSKKELGILEALMRSPDRVVERQQLLDSLYGYDDYVQDTVVESHLSRLRAKLKHGGAEVNIHAVRGVGYFIRKSD